MIHHRQKIFTSASTVVIVALTLLQPGCNRSFYRKQADREVSGLVNTASGHLDRPMPECFSIQPDEKSRFYSPYDPDCQPMTPDDPTSHQYMECVDGKLGYQCWDKCGLTQFTENPAWREFLPANQDGQIVLNRELAMQLALVNSPDYQTALEGIYLTALDVTRERYQFDSKFYGGNSTFYDTNGVLRGGENSLTTDTDAGFTRKFAAGGELLVGVANSFVWQFAGPDQNMTNSLVNFNFVQPLLRFGGREYALESLTDSERALLANIRQFERFRRGFYTQIAVGASGVNSSAGSGFAADNAFTSNASGYLGLLETQIRIQNQQANIVSLEDNLQRQIELFKSGQLNNSLTVEQARQDLLRSQSQLLELKNGYNNTLDRYKMTLGLPPDLRIDVRDDLLHHFDMIDPQLTATQNQIATILNRLRDENRQVTPDILTELQEVIDQAKVQITMVGEDLQKLDVAVPKRIENLQMLASRPSISDGEIDPSAVDVEEFKARIAKLHALYNGNPGPDLENVVDGMGQTITQLEQLLPGPGKPIPDMLTLQQLKGPLEDVATVLSSQLISLSLEQAQTRLDTLTLVPIEISSERALMIASHNRRDWMNARAALVDQWRQIEVRANELESDLDVVFSGDLRTAGNNPTRLRSSNGNLNVGLEFDAPLDRLVERNNYRRSLITYQQSKRSFYEYQDSVNSSLRQTLREIQLSQLNFELKRAAVLVSIVQVDLANENLNAAAKGGKIDTNLSRDVTEALRDLLSAQNDFLAIWVDYQAQRMTLDLDLGTMQLDQYGMWVDPGSMIESEVGLATGSLEERVLHGTGERAGLDELPQELETVLPAPGPATPILPNDRGLIDQLEATDDAEVMQYPVMPIDGR